MEIIRRALVVSMFVLLHILFVGGGTLSTIFLVKDFGPVGLLIVPPAVFCECVMVQFAAKRAGL